MAVKTGQCYRCFESCTFSYHHSNPTVYNSEIKRYVGKMYEGLVVDCVTCGDKIKYIRDEELQKWRMEVTK